MNKYEKNPNPALESVRVSAQTLELAQADLRDSVVRAVLGGSSWSEVGAVLGVSKQTAHNRYASDVEWIAKVEAGDFAQTMNPDAAESILSTTYNPEPRVDVNMDRRHNYRRTRREA
jgi:hypothetical protein